MLKIYGFFLAVLAALVFACPVAAQRKLEPVPENIKAVAQPGSPVQISIDGVYVMGGSMKSFRYTVRNAGVKDIRSIVLRSDKEGVIYTIYLGLPSSNIDELDFEKPFLVGASKPFSCPVLAYDGRSRSSSSLLSVDLVLFDDGTTWGPDLQEKREYLLGYIDGQKRLLAELKAFVARKDDAGLRSLITREPMLPEMSDLPKLTKRQEGLKAGYFTARLKMQGDMQAREDLSGIPARIRDLERALGVAPPNNDNRMQVSLRNVFKEPVKVLGISVSGKNYAVDERFASVNDWANGFKIRLKNTSGKTIRHVSYDVEFRDTVRVGAPFLSEMYYGPNPSPRIRQEEYHKSEPIVTPGENLEVMMNDKEAVALKDFLRRFYPTIDVTRVSVGISTIYFDDNTKWSGGQYWKQNPEDGQKWLPM
ncbi:MAG: hypothetical protein QM785_09530 [Pyrinomonadaceae bacterium]